MKAPPKKRNMNKYCKFHRDWGHDTSEYFQLKQQIETLIQEGYLQEYISRVVANNKETTNQAPQNVAPAQQKIRDSQGQQDKARPPHEIRTISGGHVTGDTTKARKEYVRQAREVRYDHQINMAEHVA